MAASLGHLSEGVDVGHEITLLACHTQMSPFVMLEQSIDDIRYETSNPSIGTLSNLEMLFDARPLVSGTSSLYSDLA